MSTQNSEKQGVPAQPNLFAILLPYRRLVAILIILAVGSNALTLFLPKLISRGIDDFARGVASTNTILWQFAVASLAVFILTYLQSVVQTYASERVARDMRAKIADKISQQSYTYIQEVGANKLLTNLTSDIDSIKLFVSQAIVSIASSLVIILGASAILLSINWKLALAVLAIIPIIGGTFFIILGRVRALFLQTREVIDWLNKVINESILGSSIIRVINSQSLEYNKFLAANTQAKNLGLEILKLFATLIPIITFVAGSATIIILALGGHFVITGSMSLGDFAAFNSYLGLLIFPILVIGFMSNIIAQATASYGRISVVLDAPLEISQGKLTTHLKGGVVLKNIYINYKEKSALKNVSLEIQPGNKIAIIGPTAAGKTQLLYLLTGLIKATSGTVLLDGVDSREYDINTLHNEIGFVFQDSNLFNLSLRQNIAFSDTVKDEDLAKAIETAELKDFIENLPKKLDTVVSERGTSLSGGQKQRIMLARALALNPKTLLLDDFTARVDRTTEQKILSNLQKNYPDITLISVTQKIAAVEHYDQIILLMEGEVIASGTHQQLMETSTEYVQIYNSQQSTNHYELQS
jgi:ATP-binding cassette subfamily B protein